MIMWDRPTFCQNKNLKSRYSLEVMIERFVSTGELSVFHTIIELKLT